MYKKHFLVEAEVEINFPTKKIMLLFCDHCELITGGGKANKASPLVFQIL